MNELTVNIPPIEDLEQMPCYLNFIIQFVTKKRIVTIEPADNAYYYSVVPTRLLMEKIKDREEFNIPCTISLQLLQSFMWFRSEQ